MSVFVCVCVCVCVCVYIYIYIYMGICNTSLNNIRAWHIDGTTNKKNTYDFYKVLTFQ